LDWDRVLAGVSREEMQQLFDAGYERGVSDTRHEQAKPRPKPDWSPVSGGQVGPDLERVQPILIAAAEAQLDGHLSDFESEFTDSLGIKVCRYGARTFVSNKMWTIIAQLEEKLERLGFIT
jgi:hypothetical protein